LRNTQRQKSTAMSDESNLERLDRRFTEIYEAARARVLERQKQRALIVIDDDVLLLYRTGHPVERFPGLRPPLYVKMKTLGHMPLAVYCLLHEDTGKPLSQEKRAEVGAYRATLEACAGDLDTREEVASGLLPRPNLILAKVWAILDAAIIDGQISPKALAELAHGAREEIIPVLAAAARVQIEACHIRITQIRHELLSPEQWSELRVLVLGPYMARQGQNFLQYFAQLLDTPMQADRRLVYYDGDDLEAAFARLGTTMLDAEASTAIFGDRDRLHRDVLADATTQYLSALTQPHRKSA
jgi:hypothetical protein